MAPKMPTALGYRMPAEWEPHAATWLAWPVMVIPTYLVVTYRDELMLRYPGMGDPIYWAWAFATTHIIVMALCFWLRFRHGKWKTMRVIEQAPTT